MVADVKQSRAFLNASLLQNWLNRLGPVLGLLLVIGIFSILMDTPGRFLSPNNLRIVLSQTVIVAIGAIGMTSGNACGNGSSSLRRRRVRW